jgi:hypothetical protein
MSSRSLRPSLSLVISVLALVIAMGGTGYAAAKINGGSIKAGTLPGSALKAKTVKGAKVRNDTLTGTQVKESTLGKVPAAATADTVAPGVVGSAALGEITRRSDAASIAAGTNGAATASCLPGERAIGGGNDGSFSFRVIASRNTGPDAWTVYAFNSGGSASTLTVYAYCLAP